MNKITRRKFLVRGAGLGTIILSSGLPIANAGTRIAVAGLQGGGADLLRTLSQTRGCRVSAIWDPDGNVMRRMARTAPEGALAVDRFERLIELPQIDLIAIAAPPAQRLPMIEAAARKGKHVVVSHPAADSLDDAERLHNQSSRLHAAVEHFPSDPAWDDRALLPWLTLEDPRRVEIHVLTKDANESCMDELALAATILGSELPHRAVALGNFERFSAEFLFGDRRISCMLARSLDLPPEIDRRAMITVENRRESTSITLDSWTESEAIPAEPPWLHALQKITVNPSGWAASVRRTACVAALTKMLGIAIEFGEFSWRRA